MTFASILAARGYALMRCFQGSDAYRRLAQHPADLLVILSDLWDASADELCRTVRDRGLITPNTPILSAIPGPLRATDRSAGLEAGAWEVVGLPVDADQLMLRVDQWVRAKLYADSMIQTGLLDEDGEIYNVRGVMRRLAEVTAGARRLERPLACIMLRAESTARDFERVPVDRGARATDVTGAAFGLSTEICRHVAAALKEHTRASDAIGRLSGDDFIVIAPDTDGVGAVGLARRLQQALESVLAVEGRALRVRAACYSVNLARNAPIQPDDVLARTAAALQDRSYGEDISLVEASPM